MQILERYCEIFLDKYIALLNFKEYVMTPNML